MQPYTVYTDGACRDNQNNQPGSHNTGRRPEGAIGIYSSEGLEISRRVADSMRPHTNNQAELMAIYVALLNVPTNRHIIIKTDSMNCINTFNHWIHDWIEAGGYKRDGQRVANWNIIEAAWNEMKRYPSVTVRHVPRGSEYGNRRADELANLALPQQQAHYAYSGYAEAY